MVCLLLIIPRADNTDINRLPYSLGYHFHVILLCYSVFPSTVNIKSIGAEVDILDHSY